jgi:hypothetical protein
VPVQLTCACALSAHNNNPAATLLDTSPSYLSRTTAQSPWSGFYPFFVYGR